MRTLTYGVAFMASIITANALTGHLGLVSFAGLAVTAGTFAAAFSFIMRDGIQRNTRRPYIIPGFIVAGALLSALVAPAALAVASGLAFLVSELVDWGVFTPLRSNLPVAVLLSSVAAAPVDTVLFLQLAGFPLTFNAVLGQFIVKTGMAALAAAFLVLRERGESAISVRS